MTAAWISLSTRWSLTSVQAALNVIISVLATVGIWAVTRFWWQQGSACLCINSEVPLSALLTLSSLGEGWDVVKVLRRQIFAKENWRVLLQLVVVIAVTLASMLSGPIAQVSLRSGRTIQTKELGVLQTIKGGGATGNLLNANVFWNNTIQMLDQAAFPNDQLLDYLPPSTAAWTYVTSEWNPTWSMTCNYTAETVLHNVTGTGNSTFYDPVDAFPVYRDTYHQSWLNSPKFRIQADFTSWNTFGPQKPFNFKDALFFILIEPDPEIDNRLNTNNESLAISISALHVKDFNGLYWEDSTEAAATIWRPIGPVRNASFTRIECSITRKPIVSDENAIPWVWTNDTYAITLAYQNYWAYQIEEANSKNLSTAIPDPEELLRFYQAYMISVNTIDSLPTSRAVSIWVDTVQLSSVFLAMLIILTCLTFWLTGRYFWFLRRYKSELEKSYIPDGKIEWMIHAAKTGNGAEEEMHEGKRPKDRDHFRAASVGYIDMDMDDLENAKLRRPSLARVYTNKASVTAASSRSIRGSLSKDASQLYRPSLLVHDVKNDRNTDEENKCEREITPSSVDSNKSSKIAIINAAKNFSSGPI